MIQFPRLYNSSGFVRVLNPISLSLTMNLTPLSTASIVLPRGEGLPKRSWVELFDPYGSIGMFRVRSPHDAYGAQTTSAELEHMISEVGDYLVKEELDEMMSANTAMQRVFKGYKGTMWKLGSVSALGSGKIAVDAKYDRVLDAMLAILDQKPDCYMAFDFSTKPWTVSIKKKPTDVTAECRLARNATSAEISYDDSELCTRVYYQTFTTKDGKTTSKWNSKDASTKNTYGLVERTVSTSSDMSSDEISSVVNTYLEEHKEPKVTVRIEAEELASVTGESMDRFTLGKLLRVVIPDYNVVVSKNITSLTWNDLYNDPRRVTVLLGDEPDTVVTFLHNLDSKGAGGGGGGGGSSRKKKKKEKEYSTYFNQTDYEIEMWAKRVNKAEDIFQQAGMKLDSKGVLLYAVDKTKDNYLTSQLKVTADGVRTEVKNAKKELQSSIKQQADKISLVVEGTGSNAKIKRAAIVASINNGKSNVSISADAIDIDGLVNELTTYHLDVEYIGAHQLFVDGESQFSNGLTVGGGDLDCEDIACKDVDCDSMTFDDHSVSWKSKPVLTTATLTDSKAFVYKSSGQEYTMLGKLVLGTTSDTIYYLGR